MRIKELRCGTFWASPRNSRCTGCWEARPSRGFPCTQAGQFDTNRVGGLTQARKMTAMAEAYSIPVIPHAGQMHNYHVVMASVNSPMAEFFPVVDVEVGNELFWYIFNGEPTAKDGFIDLDESVPGLGLTINEAALEKFEVTE